MHLKATCLLAGLATATIAPARAEDFSYADPFGNLVVESDAGHKRIIVGQAHDAGHLAKFLDAENVETAYLTDGDRIFADSNGNLTIVSGSGYKRILIGRGGDLHTIARALHARQQARFAPAIEESDAAERDTHPVVCTGPAGVIKGRSYMYGVDRGQTPVLVRC